MSSREIAELGELLEALCEERITPAELARLEQIVLADPAAARFYLEYLHLHGTLLWDTAKGAQLSPSASPAAPVASPLPPAPLPAPQNKPQTAGPTRTDESARSQRAVRMRSAIVAALVLVVSTGIWWSNRVRKPDGPGKPVGPGEVVVVPVNPPRANASTTANADSPTNAVSTGTGTAGTGTAGTGTTATIATAEIPDRGRPERTNREGMAPAPIAAANGGTPAAPNPQPEGPAKEFAQTGPIVSFIDSQLAASWEASEVQPSGRAEESEWLRRVSLDIVGRIPTTEQAARFLADTQPDKRERVIDELLDDPLYVRNWTTIWTNLLVGRSTGRSAERVGLQKFLREVIARNVPWKQTVYELVSAEGTPQENGAAGFLLTHLNNEAVPATAITARVLLGTQVQCTQCHNHPFNEWKQNQFWELNSFFQQTARVDRPRRDPESGTMLQQAALVNREAGGPIFFETRSGLMRAAFPKFHGIQIDPAPETNRRRELARLMVEDENRQVARAFVNRMWEHFFGAAFTRPVDDMGPHNPPTHPAVLERLTEEFVQSGYDTKQLIRWICRTDAYQLSSRFGESNAVDNPSIGNPPLFSRVYVKSMTAEQLYDSLLVATRAEEAPTAIRLDLDRQRDQWIQQFIVDYQTEENDEATTFDGSIPQALLMMNSDLVSAAISQDPGTLLHDVLTDRGTEVEKIRRLTLAALSRYPTAKEVTALRKVLRDRMARAPRTQSREVLLAEGLQDVFWALLNSNEFVLVH